MTGCEARDSDLFRISCGESVPLLSTRMHLIVCPTCRARVGEFSRVSGLLETAYQGARPTTTQTLASSPWALVVIAGGILAVGSLGWRFYDAQANSLVSPGPVARTGSIAPVFPVKEKGKKGPRPRIHCDVTQ